MIKYVDLSVNEEEYDTNISPLIKEIFLNGQFVSNTYVEEFENNFAAYCGSKYAIALNSGTDALIFALKSVGIHQGDEVITVSNSFIATANAIVEVGATPIFVDIGDDLLIDASKIEAAITSKTKAIIPVHLMGHVCDMDKIIKIANKYNLEIIEDAAQSVGSQYKNKKTGTFGKVGCFSLHPLKNLSGITDGGVVTTDDENIAKYIQQARNHGLQNRDEQNIIGRVSRLNSINAAILNYRLKKVDDIIAHRRTLAFQYNRALSDNKNISIIQVSQDVYHSYHTYIIKARSRDALQAYLFKKGIETKIHYPLAIHQQKCYQNTHTNLSQTKHSNTMILTLPIANVTCDDVAYICQTISDFYKEH